MSAEPDPGDRGLDLDLDDAQRAVADSVAAFCRERAPEDAVRAWGAAGTFPRPVWRELAELGVLALATPEGEGGPVELVAACEALGRAVFPGPLAATVFAAPLLPEAERAAVTDGASVVCVATPPALPFGPEADVFVEVASDPASGALRAWRARPRGTLAPAASLGGEPWARGALQREAELAGAGEAGVLHDVALAALLAAAGERLVADAAEHAATRRQFGRPIGEFQAVAHPLAQASMDLAAAAGLARQAAWHLDTAGPAAARGPAAAARLAARRTALAAAETAHQVFGAVGITLEGPAFHVSRRIRQWASQVPGPEPARAALLAGLALDEEAA